MKTLGNVRSAMRSVEQYLDCTPSTLDFEATKNDVLQRIERGGLRACLRHFAEALDNEYDAEKVVRYALANHFLGAYWRSAHPVASRCLKHLSAAAHGPETLCSRDDWMHAFDFGAPFEDERFEELAHELAASLHEIQTSSTPRSIEEHFRSIASRTYLIILVYGGAARKWRRAMDAGGYGKAWHAYREILETIGMYGVPEGHIRSGLEGFAISFNRALLDCPAVVASPPGDGRGRANVTSHRLAGFLTALGASHMQAFNAWDMLLNTSDVHVPLLRLNDDAGDRSKLEFQPYVFDMLHELVDISLDQPNVRARRTIGCPFLMLPDNALIKLLSAALSHQRGTTGGS